MPDDSPTIYDFPFMQGDDAQAQARAMAQALRRQQMQGLALQALTGGQKAGPMVGQELSQQAGQQQALGAHLLQAAPEFQQQQIKTRQAGAEEQAWKDPAANAALRQMIGMFAPGMQLPENMPTQVLRNIAPLAEHYGQAQLGAQLRLAMQGLSQQKDPNTGEVYLLDKGTGATYYMSGAPRTAGVRRYGPGGPMQPGPQRQPAGAGPVPGPVAPRRAGPPPGAIKPPEMATQPEPVTTVTQKDLDALKKDMDAQAASSRSVFGQAGNVIFRGARNMALLKRVDPATGKPQQLTIPEWQEVAAGMYQMQAGGVPTQQMLYEGAPQDVQGNLAKLKSWLTSSPYAPDRQAWMDRFINNVEREERVANQSIGTARRQRLASHIKAFQYTPNNAYTIAQAYGIPRDEAYRILTQGYREGEAQPAPPAPTAAPEAKRKRYNPETGNIE